MKKLFILLPVALFGFCLVFNSCSNGDLLNQEPSSSKSTELEEIPEIWPFNLEVDGQTVNGELTLDWNHETETANEF